MQTHCGEYSFGRPRTADSAAEHLTQRSRGNVLQCREKTIGRAGHVHWGRAGTRAALASMIAAFLRVRNRGRVSHSRLAGSAARNASRKPAGEPATRREGIHVTVHAAAAAAAAAARSPRYIHS